MFVVEVGRSIDHNSIGMERFSPTLDNLVLDCKSHFGCGFTVLFANFC